MREWSLGPGSPLLLRLAADFRSSNPDYTNDHIWELETSGGDPPALSFHTTYGLRARSMRIFPRFIFDRQAVSDPAAFPLPPCLKRFHSNYLSVRFSPLPGLEVTSETWVPDSHSLLGSFTAVNRIAGSLSFQFELCGQLIPLIGDSLTMQAMQSANVLTGRCADLAPVIFLAGGPHAGMGPYPALALDMTLAPGDSRTVSWAQAALAEVKDSFELARRLLARPQEPDLARIEFLDEAHSFEIFTGDPDWDAAFSLSQAAAFRLFFGSGPHLSHPSFVFSREVDQGFSPRGDGSDHPYLWSGQSPLEAYYISSLLPGGRQELVPVEEFAGKVLAAVEARKNNDLVIIARTEALIAGWGHEEALKRAHCYEEAGADCILVHSKSKQPDEILEFISRWDGRAPLVLVPTNYPSLTEADLLRVGKVKMVIYANQMLRAAICAQEALLAEIKRARGIHTVDSTIVPVSKVFELQDVAKMKEQEKRYLR